MSIRFRKSAKSRNLKGIFAGFLVSLLVFTGVGQVVLNENDVYALPQDGIEQVETPEEGAYNTENSSAEAASNDGNTSEVSEDGNNNSEEPNEEKVNDGMVHVDKCKKALGSLGWIVCPMMEKISDAIDWLYGKIESILAISPVEAKEGTPIYEVWKYCRGVTNIVFIIFLLIVIYSQVTGWGINNYGIKKILPKLIVTVILVNLSFLICSLLVDISNILGNGIRGLFGAVEETVLNNMSGGAVASTSTAVSMAELYTSLASGAVLAIGAGVAIAFEPGVVWMLIPVVLGAIVAVATGLITIALRQAVVMMLVMIAPLAFVANIMPNTENLFTKWKKLMERMLVFYPMFSLLFGASSLAGFAIIMSSSDGFGLLLGIAVQVFPLFFSWKLMQMSGTVLGTINSKLRGMTAKPLARSRALAEAKRQQANLRSLAVGKGPSSHLRRFMDNKKALEAAHMKNLQTIRNNEANTFVQRTIGGGYDGTKAQGNSDYLKPNKYTKAAKDASTSGLESSMTALDTEHTLSNYGKYFVAKDVRDRVKAAEEAGNEVLAKRLKARDSEYRRDMRAGKAYLEYSRAQMTKESDEEADFNFMVGEYLSAYKGFDPKANESENFSKYRHYIASSAGGLGEEGQTRVLGKIIAKAAAVESNQRRDINIIASKYPHAKKDFRNMLVGYYVDDNGYATDKEGNVLPGEKYRGYLLQHDPSQLQLWDQVDEKGRKYYDWYDGNQFVTRIYETDKAAVKELLTNFDTPINDPINNLYGILAGVKPGVDGVPEHVGLNAFRTTIGRSLASFKEKNAAFSPMVSEMIKKGYIKNYAQEYLAYLDSLNKATKPGAFNMQDGDAIEMFATIMNPDNWEEVFPTELIRGFVNINGDPIYGIRFDKNGNKVKVPAEEATRDELMERVKEKFIVPAAHKMTVMMSRQTQNTMDNQKAGTVEKWKELKEVFDKKWGKDSPIGESAYEQDGDMRQITKEIRDNLYTVDANGVQHTFTNANNNHGKKKAGPDANTDEVEASRVNHNSQIYDLYNASLDANEFAAAVASYCRGYREINWLPGAINDFMVQEGYGVTKEQVYEFVEDQLLCIDYD